MARTRKHLKAWSKGAIWTLVAVACGFLLWRAFQPVPVLVALGTVQPDRLRILVEDDGHTRVRDRYTIHAPIQGWLLRVALEPGDAVEAGKTLLAEFVPTPPGLLDARSRAEAEARLARARAALEEATARRAQAATESDYARAELGRISDLFAGGFESGEILDRVRRDEQRATQGLQAAEFAVQVAGYELELARASLEQPGTNGIPSANAGERRAARVQADGRLPIHSPVDGRVLRVFEESARALLAGAPILEVGDTRALEVVADFLSQDAVKAKAGMTVLLGGWGGEAASGEETILRGRVRTVEPGGFTKISALGVEEQRVNVIIDPVDAAEDWAALGDGYRVFARIVLWEKDDVLTVPGGALFRDGEGWAVFVVEAGIARHRRVAIGRRSGLQAEVLDGLTAGERVVLYPSDLLGDGTVVTD